MASCQLSATWKVTDSEASDMILPTKQKKSYRHKDYCIDARQSYHSYYFGINFMGEDASGFLLM